MKKSTVTEDPKITRWIEFFNADSLEKLETLSKSKDSAISEAANLVLDLNRDEKVRAEAEQRENALRMYKTETELREQKGEARGHKKGLAEGEKKGKQEKAIEIAKNALSMGLNIEQIIKLTGLSEEEIKKL